MPQSVHKSKCSILTEPQICHPKTITQTRLFIFGSNKKNTFRSLHIEMQTNGFSYFNFSLYLPRIFWVWFEVNLLFSLNGFFFNYSNAQLKINSIPQLRFTKYRIFQCLSWKNTHSDRSLRKSLINHMIYLLKWKFKFCEWMAHPYRETKI